METGSLSLKYDVWKSAWLLFAKLQSSNDDNLQLNALRELWKVSEKFPNTKYSWCLQLREILEKVGLLHLHQHKSPTKTAKCTPLVLRKFRQFLIQSDVTRSQNSNLYPHYKFLKNSFNPAPFLECGLPSCFAIPILQVRLNSNSIYANGSWFNLGYFTDENCKLCGDPLSFYHTMWECPGTKGIRDAIFPQVPVDPLELMQEVSKVQTLFLPFKIKKLFSNILHTFYGKQLTN